MNEAKAFNREVGKGGAKDEKKIYACGGREKIAEPADLFGQSKA